MTDDFTWYQRASAWVIDKLPPILVTETERIGLSFGFVCVGITSILNLDRPSAFAAERISSAAVINWSIMLILGGLFTIWGMVTSSRLVERMGLTLSGLGCVIYGTVAYLAGTTLSAVVVAVLFFALAIIKFIRLMVSTVQQANMRHYRHPYEGE